MTTFPVAQPTAALLPVLEPLRPSKDSNVTRLTDRLQAARKKLFVGRTAERSFFEEAISADEMPFCVLHISGLGGVGKTTLLREFASLCAARNVHTTTLDARNLDPSPEAFLGALAIANGLPPGDSPVEFLAQLDTRYVIFIDTYEMLARLMGGCASSSCRSCPIMAASCWPVATRRAPSGAWMRRGKICCASWRCVT
jgi:hypothetical protein